MIAGRRAWNLVALLVAQIAKDTYSHLYASFRGWSYAPNSIDAFFLDWLDAQAVMHHRPGKVPPRPAKRPWETGPKQSVPVHDPSREERRRTLQERLGLISSEGDSASQRDGEGDDR